MRDYTGQVFNGVTFVERYQCRRKDGRQYHRWRVRCSCGEEFTCVPREIITLGRKCERHRRPVPRGGALAEIADAVLVELVRTASYTVVAKQLSAQLGVPVTKNMITGRLWRIGASTTKPLRRAPLPPMPAPGACVFPLGHPGDAKFRFCGEPAGQGRVYCGTHHKLTHIKEAEGRVR